MKICTLSDIHGHLPTVPECDLLLIAGDICPPWDHAPWFQDQWLRSNLNPWLKSLPVKQVVMCWGNHDFIGEAPEIPELACEILTDRSFNYEGINIWGSPWQLPFCDWAFNLPEEELAEKYNKIPDDTHVIITHGPPFGYGDLAPPHFQRTEWEHVGSKSLIKRMEAIKPLLVVTGHIHCSYGLFESPYGLVMNASYVDEKYLPRNAIAIFEIENNKIVSRSLEPKSPEKL